jgi:transcription elongation factor Elf1
MATVQNDIQSFMRQWLQTATAGKVTVDFAWFQDRMELRCHQCGAVCRCAAPASVTEIDWNLQAWVNTHSAMGTHGKDEEKTPVDPIPITADFKSIPPKKPFGNIDDSAAKAEIIKAQMEKYKAEQESKNLEGKIDWLKKVGAQKKELAEAEAAQDAEAKEKALLKLLELMQTVTIPKAVPPIQVATGMPKKAKIATGRRFR